MRNFFSVLSTPLITMGLSLLERYVCYVLRKADNLTPSSVLQHVSTFTIMSFGVTAGYLRNHFLFNTKYENKDSDKTLPIGQTAM